LATKLGSSLASFLLLFSKGMNLDHLFLFFQMWFPYLKTCSYNFLWEEKSNES
jgi:hypothetical protein